MQNNLLSTYNQKKHQIKSRLEDFKNLPVEKQYQEFLFCLLTPQSNAQRCWQAAELIKKLKNPTHKQILEILSKKTRFHNTKAKRILNAKETWKKIQPLFTQKNTVELRNQISKEVDGYGLKEASHFLRNIGLSKNQIAILDRHILRNLKNLDLIQEEKIKSQKNYLEIEKIFINYANSINIPSDELDLLWWSQENGEIFK